MRPNSTFQINIIRIVFLFIAIFSGMAVCATTRGAEFEVPVWIGILAGVGLAMLVIFFEHASRQFTLRGFSRATFGLMIGIFCAWLLNKLPLKELVNNIADDATTAETIMLMYGLVTYLVMGFLGVVLSLRSGQEDFAFIIPYIRFRQSNVNEQLLLLDGSAILDGRLPELIEAKVIEGNLIVPQYILEEINQMANSDKTATQERGKRALDLLGELRKSPHVKLTVSTSDEFNDTDAADMRLVSSAQVNNAKLITTDDALAKSARLQNVTVMNLDEVAKAFQPTVVVGEKLKLAITRTGKEEHQGVGYLQDGSMIVVNQGVSLIGTTQNVVVVSKLQTGTGLLVFAELDSKRENV